MSIVGDIAGAIGLVKQVKELADQTKNLELKTVIVDLQSKLLDVKEEINELREENAKLKEEVKRALAPPEVAVKDGMYYKGDDGPFCTGCYDSQKKMIRLIGAMGPEKKLMGIHHKCPSCKATY
jgi:hypothetical protein